MRINILPYSIVIGLFVLFIGCEVPETELVDYEANDLTNFHVAFLVGEGFHDGETFVPMGYLTSRGATVTIIGVEPGEVGSYNSDFTVNIQISVDDVTPENFDALIIPGGESPAWLREHDNVVEFTRTFFEQQGITAAICHGPQVLITAGVMTGKTATGFEGIQEELEEAGVDYYDESVIRDEHLITSRIPDDLYDFTTAIEQALLETRETI